MLCYEELIVSRCAARSRWSWLIVVLRGASRVLVRCWEPNVMVDVWYWEELTVSECSTGCCWSSLSVILEGANGVLVCLLGAAGQMEWVLLGAAGHV